MLRFALCSDKACVSCYGHIQFLEPQEQVVAENNGGTSDYTAAKTIIEQPEQSKWLGGVSALFVEGLLIQKHFSIYP